jgi:hypothetical protein
MSEPFDQSLYDAVMASSAHGSPGVDSGDYMVGYENGALVAARISAERHQVSDEALWGIYHAAYCKARFHPDSNPDDLVPGESEVNAIMAGIRAVRAAIEAAKENDQ